MLYLARAVYEKRLLADLAEPMPDVAVAREVLSWFHGPGEAFGS